MNYSQTLGASTGQEFLHKLDETEKESEFKSFTLHGYFTKLLDSSLQSRTRKRITF